MAPMIQLPNQKVPESLSFESLDELRVRCNVPDMFPMFPGMFPNKMPSKVGQDGSVRENNTDLFRVNYGLIVHTDYEVE